MERPTGDHIRVMESDLDDGIIDLEQGAVLRARGTPPWAPEPLSDETLAAMHEAAAQLQALGDQTLRVAQFWDRETLFIVRLGERTTRLRALNEGGTRGEPMNAVWRVAVEGKGR